MNNHKNPWTILSSHMVYDNPWISLTEFKVINPSGGNGIYGKVHFKNVAVGVIPFDSDWNTWLVGQYRFPLEQYSWEIPEGGGSSDEDSLDAAKRELLEETGLVANEWIKICTLHLSNSVSDEMSVIYMARELEQKSSAPEDTEQLCVKKLPFDEVVRMQEAGEITDAMSVAAIQQIRLMFQANKLKR